MRSNPPSQFGLGRRGEPCMPFSRRLQIHDICLVQTWFKPQPAVKQDANTCGIQSIPAHRQGSPGLAREREIRVRHGHCQNQRLFVAVTFSKPDRRPERRPPVSNALRKTGTGTISKADFLKRIINRLR